MGGVLLLCVPPPPPSPAVVNVATWRPLVVMTGDWLDRKAGKVVFGRYDKCRLVCPMYKLL